MEFVANRKQLLASVELAATVADPKAGYPILSMVRLEARAAGVVGLYATDLVRAYEGDVPAEVRRSGAVLPRLASCWNTASASAVSFGSAVR